MTQFPLSGILLSEQKIAEENPALRVMWRINEHNVPQSFQNNWSPTQAQGNLRISVQFWPNMSSDLSIAECVLEPKSGECLEDLAQRPFYATQIFWMRFVRYQKLFPGDGEQ